MCGRFALHRQHGEIRQSIAEDLGHDVDDWVDEEAFYPRYNVAPRTYNPVVRARDESSSGSSSGGGSPSETGHSRANKDDSHLESGESGTEGTSPEVQHARATHLVLQSMKWGVVPHWSKVEDNTLNTINARSGNILEGGGMWASLKGSKRCIVPCDGYYEWLTKSLKTKLPHFLRHRDRHLMFFAGLWDCVHLPGTDRLLYTYSIVTTDAPPAYSWLHDRQPVILTSKADIATWLDTSQGWNKELVRLLKPYGGPELDCYQVPQEVGKVGTESPTFVEPIKDRKDGIEAMFARQAKRKEKGSLHAENTATREDTKTSTQEDTKESMQEDTEGSRQEDAKASTLADTKTPIAKKPSPQKRKRSTSPLAGSPASSSQETASKTPSKKPKLSSTHLAAASATEKTSTAKASASPAKTTKSSSKALPSSPAKASPKKSKDKPAKEKEKITAFFQKT